MLDVACGIGRHVSAFAEEGYYIEGLDLSEEFINRARDRINEKEVDDRVELHVHDMRELGEWGSSFDLITNFWNSLGYYDKVTDVMILTQTKRLLSEEGVVTIEMSNKEFYVKNFDSSSVREAGENSTSKGRSPTWKQGGSRRRLTCLRRTPLGTSTSKRWNFNLVYTPRLN